MALSATRTAGPLWRLAGGGQLTPAPFLVAGIVNITPDSFSDGGRFFSPEAALARVAEVAAQGADMADLGAESTRPGASEIGRAEELRRLMPVLEGAVRLRREAAGGRPFFISVDTWRAGTAAAALEAGADIINDISGGLFDPDMDRVLAEHRPGYVLGHSPARPRVMQRAPRYAAPVLDVLRRHFTERLNALVRAGLPEECISLDPCIGFGKTLAHTIDILAGAHCLAALGRPLYYGVSRKSSLVALSGLPDPDRDGITQAAVALLAAKGVHIHRVHNVPAARAALRMAEAFGIEGAPPQL